MSINSLHDRSRRTNVNKLVEVISDVHSVNFLVQLGKLSSVSFLETRQLALECAAPLVNFSASLQSLFYSKILRLKQQS